MTDYNDDSNPRVLAGQAPGQVLPQPTQPASSGGLWDWIKANKGMVIIIIIIVIALIWWFCMRKSGDATVTTNITAPGTAARPNQLNITRTKTGF